MTVRLCKKGHEITGVNAMQVTGGKGKKATVCRTFGFKNSAEFFKPWGPQEQEQFE